MKDLIEDLSKIICNLSIKIFEIYQNNSFHVSFKDLENKDPLTTADIFANEYLKEKLLKVLPEASWVSEESKLEKERLQKEWVWVIDPIDGTREFVKKEKGYSISIGLLKKNFPVLGIVSMPAEDYFVAGGLDDNQTFLFSQKISNNERNYYSHFEYKKINLKSAKIVVSKSEWNSGKLESLPGDWNFYLEGSVARKLALVSLQKYDLLISLTPKNEWDICGGLALLYASGQKSITLEYDNERKIFKPFEFNKYRLESIGLIAGNPYLVDNYAEFHLKNQIPVYLKYD